MPDFLPPEAAAEPIHDALARADTHELRIAALAPDAPSGSVAVQAARRPARRPPGWMRHPALAFVAGVAIVGAGWLATPPVVGALAHLEQETAVLGVVTEYASALTRHDAEAANAIVMPDATIASTAMLSNDVYDTATVPESFTPQSVHVIGDEAFVEVVLGEELWRPVAAVRLELVGSTWQLTSGLAVPMHVADTIAQLGGIESEEVPEDVASGERAVWLYPGTYWLVPVRTPLLASEVPSVVEVGSGESELAVSAQPSVALEQSMRVQAAAFAQACTDDPTPGCGDIEQSVDGVVTISLTADQGVDEVGDDVVSLAFTATVTEAGTVTEHTVVVLADLSDGEHASLVTVAAEGES